MRRSKYNGKEWREWRSRRRRSARSLTGPRVYSESSACVYGSQ